MDFYALQSVVGALGSVISVVAPVAGAIYTWLATRNAAARKEIGDLKKLVSRLETRLDTTDHQLQAAAHTADALAATVTSLAEYDKRISRVEHDLEHLPSKNEMHELQLVIVRLEGTVGRLEEKVTGIGHTVGNLDSYMRTESKGTP